MFLTELRSARSHVSMRKARASRLPNWSSLALILLGGASGLSGCNKDKGADPGGGNAPNSGGAEPVNGSGSGSGKSGGGGGRGGNSGGGSSNAASGGDAGSGGETAIDGASGGAGGSDQGGPETPPRKSTGCGTPAPFHGDKEFKVMLPTRPGVTEERSYFVVAPQEEDYDPDKPLAVMFVLHGSNGTATPGHYNLDNAAGGEAGKNTIYVHPQGIILEGFEGYGNGWNEDCNGYDMPFFDEMLAQVKSDFCVDENLIFAGGYSWGGDFASSLGCCRGDVVRAVIPTNSGEMNAGQTGTCSDEISAFRLSYSDDDNAYSDANFQSVLSFFREAHGCSDTFTDGPVPAGTQNGVCKTYSGCDKPVVECVYPGIGHRVPNGWGEDVWAFMSSF